MSSRAPDIYALDPAARQLLQLETFRNKFVVNEFVQGLSAANIAYTARQSSGALDPKPYIRTFEQALARLQDLREQTVKEGKDIDKDVKSAETQFVRRNGQLEETFRDINATFTGLQTRISEVGKTAITIGIQLPLLLSFLVDALTSTGVQLESIEKQRRRAMEAKDLFTYYLDFAYDNTSDRLDALQMSDEPKGKSQCAIMTRRLLTLSKDLDAEGRIRESIEKYGERLEKDLLKAFDKSYRRGDLREMRVRPFSSLQLLKIC
jgi:exocyst complex component 5